MNRSEADAALRQALLDHADAYELRDADELLDDFAAIVHWQKVEDDHRSRYSHHYARQGNTPHHVAVGLFQSALGHILQTDEDEP